MEIRVSIRGGIFACGLSIMFLTGSLQAQEDTGVKKHGVVYNIAEDRELEKIGGIYEPEGLDKYVKRKFDMVLQKMDDLDARMTNVEKELGILQSKLDTALNQDQKKIKH
ncbi:MAG: hypothetical protein NC930_00065 [Candidatus Omnitrophica bacterium]|nr:hypothetical protein [Candidatus Omnitrophota bacterium]